MQLQFSFVSSILSYFLFVLFCTLSLMSHDGECVSQCFKCLLCQVQNTKFSLCWSAQWHALHHLPCTVSLNEANGHLSICKISRYAWIPSSQTLEASRYWYCWFNQINWGGVLPFWVLRLSLYNKYQNYPEILGPWSIKQGIKPQSTRVSWSMRVPQHCSIHGVPE